MALSFEESKKKLVKPAAATMSMRTMSVQNEPVVVNDADESFTYDTKSGYYRVYPRVDNYADKNFSRVDEQKNIVVSENQNSVTQEINSQLIPFELNRYYDGVDLDSMQFNIHYVNSKDKEGISIPVNYCSSDTKIRFEWLLDHDVTYMSGDVAFEIVASGSINIAGENEQYIWRTKPNGKINITKSLAGDSTVRPTTSWYTQFVSVVDGQIIKAETYADQAAAYAEDARDAAEEIRSAIDVSVAEKIDGAVDEKLKAYDTAEQVDKKISDSEIAIQTTLSNDYYKKNVLYTKDEVYNKDAVDTIKRELSGKVDNLDVEFDNATSTLTLYDKEGEGRAEISSTLIEIDGLKNFDVEFVKTTKTLKFYNKESEEVKTEIGSAVIDIDGLANFDAEFDSANKALNFYKKTPDTEKELINSVNINIDGLAAFRVTYDENTGALQFFNGDTPIGNVTITSDPTEEWVTANITPLQSQVNTNTSNITILTNNNTTLSNTVADLQKTVTDMSENTGYQYYAEYGRTTLVATGEETDNVFTLYEVTEEGTDGEVKSQFVITGGSGGASASTSLKVERITASPLTVTTTDKVEIAFNCTSTDSDGETVDCSYVWKKGSTVIKSGALVQGPNTFDLTEFVTAGTHKFTLTVTDEGGSMSVKTWTVQMVDVRIESAFNDQAKYTANEPVSFTYTPYGAIEKTVHFKLDGKELPEVTTSTSGLLQSYSLPAQAHGAHLLEVWITAKVNSDDIETDHIFKDIIWFDEESDVPVIGCIYRYDYYGVVDARQYNATDITYVVYDPNSMTPVVDRLVDGQSIGTQTLDKSVDMWSYKTADIGEKELAISCGDTSVAIKLNVAALGITIEPVTAGLAFDFNPTGHSNNEQDRVNSTVAWSDATTGVTMSVSPDFDWINGGYQRDDNGDQYFCIKAGTFATMNYNLFGADYDPKALGKEFKFVFKTTNVKKRSSTFLSCIEQTTAEDETSTFVGIDMTVENANIYARNKSIFVPYSEEDIIEFEFNINKDSDIPLLMTYEDGVANRPLIYAADSSFMQIVPKPIVIGSNDCDVHIYRMKAYDTSLSDKEILSNFIADARNADEMISRYERNDIYDENGTLTPEVLAERCPDLRIIMIDAPWFTNDKDDKVGNTTIRQIYKGGDAVYDNWTCTGAKHSGQGTSSNKYGYAGRNLRLIMNEDESLFTFNGVDESGNPITGKTVTLGKDSVPNAFWNIKVNIASSENQNNALFARRYNEFNPVVRAAKAKDPRVKDTMEFYNCVVFIRENDPDLTKHREFNDTSYHFYAIGNVGDDKKTDKSRVNDSKDPKECIVEITDYDVPLAEFPTGIGGDYIAPSEWKSGNKAYDSLYSAYTYDEEGKFKAFGAESYEFRYEMKGITDEQRQENIDAWRDFYTFVVTSTDEEFVAHFEDHFILDSALYYYLFTERYLMVDNRAKNSFWNRCRVYITQTQFDEMGEEKAKGYIVDDAKASINEGYRWNLCYGYDFDTSLGISNTGQLVLTYGQEDVDKYANEEYIYRAAESNFFCRIRDLFADQLKGMFQSRESLRAWSSNDLINQWDNAQGQFPEELWRLDVERKYIRTYRGVSVDNSIAGAQDPTFLEPMLNGRKKYQRRQIERNNELYFATKYVSTFATDDFIRMRFTKPEQATIAPDYTLYLTPYTDMYIAVAFGNTAPVTFRAKAGIPYPVTRKTDSEALDIVLIYGASFIQAIGDLSRCYLREGNFSKATRLQSIIIGSNAEGYKNESLTLLSLENNKLLEYLDIRQTTELKTVIDLAQCNNLVELHAEGSGITGVIFANGGKLEKAYLPAVISLTMKNLQYINTFDVLNYSRLEELTVENVPAINTYNIVNSSPLLNTVRLIGVNWDESYNIQDTSILDRMIDMRGKDDTTHVIPQSVLTGAFHAAIVKEKNKADYNAAWPFLTITENTLTPQFIVTFVNDDGTVLDVQYVDKGTKQIVDPIVREENPIAVPTKASTASTSYSFSGWDTKLTFTDNVGVYKNLTIKATYTASIREYTVKYVSKGTVLQETSAPYGATVVYNGEIPTYTIEESEQTFYLFDKWDKNGYVDGNKTINAIFESCAYAREDFEGKTLGDLRPVDIYAMLKLGEHAYHIKEEADSVFTIELGSNFDGGRVLIGNPDGEEEVISAGPVVYNGTNYNDTGIKLFDEDKSFVLAIDFNMAGDSSTKGVLAQCFSGFDTSGFKLSHGSAANITWGNTTALPCAINSREMIVLRHVAGENSLHVYSSNTSSHTTAYYQKLEGQHDMKHNVSLVFGCSKLTNGTYESYGKGTIYWSKLWEEDLGHDACAQLACWPHESIQFKACFEMNNAFKTYYLSDNSGYLSSMTFIASNVLSRPIQMDGASVNDGGWATYDLNDYLNTRLFPAFPDKWKQLMKQVKVQSTIGNKSTDLSTSDCYIFVPALYELYQSADKAYHGETRDDTGTIRIFTDDASRKCTISGGQDAVAYWTRSPNVTYTGYVWHIDAKGIPSGYKYPYSPDNNIYARIMISF